MPYTKDEKVRSLLENKRVVVIGPSSHLVGKNKGSEFDKYEVVCRISDVMAKNYEKDYASRTDVMIYNNPSLAVNEYGLKMDMNPHVAMNMKMMICPSIKADHLWKDSVQDNWKKINRYNIPSSFSSKEDFDYLCNLFGCEPSGGMSAIQVILEYEPKELLITGISFYNQTDINNPNQVDCYYPGYCLPQFQVKTFNPHRAHSQQLLFNYFKNIILTKYSNIVKIDSYLNDIYKLNYHNIFQL